MLHLTPSEYALLEFLAYQRGRVFSKEQLVELLAEGGPAGIGRTTSTEASRSGP